MGYKRDNNLIWAPANDAVERTAMGRFMSLCAGKYDFAADYAALHRWSISNPAEFWGTLADFAGVRFGVQPEQVFVPGESLRTACWFSGATLNYTENILGAKSGEPAIIFCDERGRRQEISHAQLEEHVRRVAYAFVELGVEPGDRIAAVLPNCPQAVVILLAAAAVGAVFTSCSPDFGVPAIVSRFGQVKPKVLVGCDGYSYGGKTVDCMESLTVAANRLEGLERTYVVPFTAPLDMEKLPDKFLPYDSLLGVEQLHDFPQFPFDHPLYILYSSGTTGKPKCIVHGTGGVLIQHLKEHLLHTDLRADSRLFYFTTCGWMMWNWLVGALATGATIVLYDGSPFYPDALNLWRLAEEERVTVFGTSPRFLVATEKAGVWPGKDQELGGLRILLSTGSPLAGESFDFVRDKIGASVQLCSISGGTDIVSCFVLGNPLLPVYRGEIQCPGLGMAVDVFDAHGVSLRQCAGDLVCTQPFPSLPLGFWGDESGERFRDAYFSRFPGCWAQGDHAEFTEHGGVIIYGRSDAVLNPGGVRIGTAEVCDPALTVSGVVDALAVGQRKAGDERIVLFVVMADGIKLDAGMRSRICSVIRAAASPRHVPAVILEVPDIPRTISGKAVELAVRAVIHGEDVPDRGSLANPEALQYFANRQELAW